MRAIDLVEPAPLVAEGEDVTGALRKMIASGLPGLVVHDGESYSVIPASQVFRVALPQYILDDPSLGRVWDEPGADDLPRRLDGRTVRDLVAAVRRDEDFVEPAVDGDATLVEMTAVIAVAHVPLIAVVDRGRYRGVVTATRLLERLLS